MSVTSAESAVCLLVAGCGHPAPRRGMSSCRPPHALAGPAYVEVTAGFLGLAWCSSTGRPEQ
ncbi:hypothetical protein EEB14_48560 [Rhodococcus sp. WS4]|nr:hypothetical protein EEB14_48560 [Rhodococcus sp. WS4]